MMREREWVVYFHQLATLISAGIPIVQSLTILHNTQHRPLLKKITHSLQKTIEAGNTLSTGLRLYPNCFDPFTCYLVYMGEQSGTLAGMLKQIATHKEKTLHFKKQLQQALLYPATVLIITVIVIAIMLIGVVPRFAEFFQDIPGSLPKPTLFIIHLSNWLKNNGWGLLLLGILCGTFRKTLSPFFLKCPILSMPYKKNQLTQFTHSLAVTLRAGIPLTDALKLMVQAAPSKLLANNIYQLYRELIKGQSLHRALAKHSFFPLLLVQMVKTGEESGNLEEMLEKITELMTAELDYFLSYLNRLLEPLIMIVLGVLIGGLVFAMYLPIFKLGTVL